MIEEIEQQPVSRPLERFQATIFDDWQVTYVSTALAPRQEGQRECGAARMCRTELPLVCLLTPSSLLAKNTFCCSAAAGGRFRGRIGKHIFRLNQLCQSAMEPNTISNKVDACRMA